ncbi:PREDICTED: uncharacterized protein LOC108365174 [Rhagoletis zephyria]|uniref:uncharacterized protein LOC108365174 n=1 Tax=Rhagoletis zephyria TaxID=28612 RepID=UPI00081159B1|nr:PREDICTED: uncharacterized protein LOC108365174 [Rhagoletis zephyria]
MIDSSSKQISVTLTDFLQRQRVLLHGFELRCLRYIPKIVFIICEKLIKIAGKASILKIRECDHEDDLNEYNFTRHYLSSRKCKDVQSKAHSEESDSESEGDEDSKDDEHDSMETFDPDYNLQYKIDNFEVDTEKENEEEKKLIDLLDEPNGVKEMDFLKPETLARHRPSFQVLQQSLLDNIECTAPPEVIITVLTCEPKTDNDFSQTIYNYQKAINNTPNGWEKLCEERDLETLVTLLWTWFENLDSPILNTETLGLIAETKEDFEKCFFSMNMVSW